MNKKKFFICVPIYYVNDRPHIGHAYTSMAADAIARWHVLLGEEVFLSAGVDENSQKNMQAMEKVGETDLSRYLDGMATLWKGTWDDLDIHSSDFIRTTEERHQLGVRRFWEAVRKSGDIYLGEYEGWYCVGCEGYKTETELVARVCPQHPNKSIKRLKEKNYFFRLSAYREALLSLLDRKDRFIAPEARLHEIRNYVADVMADISISRSSKSVSIGIEVPGDPSQRIYVWFDALINYLTIVGYGTDEAKFKKYWPADLQLMGKDIIKFHAALWPAMIMSAAKQDPLLRDEQDQPLLPRKLFAHGFFTLDGKKISKSLGNVIDPRDLVTTYDLDTIRYFFLREIPFGEDGDFSFLRLRERYQSDLSHALGNLVHRVLVMAQKYFRGKIPVVDLARAGGKETATSLWGGVKGLLLLREQVERAYASARPDLALEAIWNGAGDAVSRAGLLQANKYIEETQPFKLIQEDIIAVAHVLYALLESCRWYAWLMHPVLPHVSRRLIDQLGMNPEQEFCRGWGQALTWGGLPAGTLLGKAEPLFPSLVEDKIYP